MPGRSRASSLFGLAPCGVCHARCITAAAVRSYRTFSPLPRRRSEPNSSDSTRNRIRKPRSRSDDGAVCFLWHFPSTGLEPGLPDVIRHTALRSSDFPPSLRRATVRSGCQHPSLYAMVPGNRRFLARPSILLADCVTHALSKIVQEVTGAVALAGIGYYVVCLWSAVAYQQDCRSLATGPEGLDASALPPVSILKPLKGEDPEIYESFRSHCLQDYPQYEIVFGVSEADDPARTSGGTPAPGISAARDSVDCLFAATRRQHEGQQSRADGKSRALRPPDCQRQRHSSGA